MKKKILALVLLLCLSVTSFTGCYLLQAFNIGMSVIETVENVLDKVEENKTLDRYKQNGKYTDELKYVFKDSERELGDRYLSDVLAEVRKAEVFVADRHAYGKDPAVEADFNKFMQKYNALAEFFTYVENQYTIANIWATVEPENDEYWDRAIDISEYYTELEADIFALNSPIYDSMYREYFFRGVDKEELSELVNYSRVISTQEYMDLSIRALELIDEVNKTDMFSESFDALYAEYVSVNNRMAALLGYENYIEYAYENMYDREYSYKDIEAVDGYVKKYISDVFKKSVDKYSELYLGKYLNLKVRFEFEDFISRNMFGDEDATALFRDYIKNLTLNPGTAKTVSFLTEFDELSKNGNLLFGEGGTAFVTYIKVDGSHVPVAYFGSSYNSSSTVAHEFGHYMNEVYSGGRYKQSYDLLEMHSQGGELLYLDYLEGKLDGAVYDIYESYIVANLTSSVVNSLTVDAFERAVYTGRYTGTNAGSIMADGKISANEYGSLYEAILKDFGIYDVLGTYCDTFYWKYIVFSSPCYYVSYSVSALSALQIYMACEEEGFSVGRDKYLKLFTYMDEDPNMTTADVLKYAGMYNFEEEELYIRLEKFLKDLV